MAVMQNRALNLLLLVLMLAACVPAPSAPTATQTASPTYTAAPSPTGTSTPTPEPTATATPKEYQVLTDALLILEGARLSDAPTLSRDQLPAARADLLKMYAEGKIPNFTSDVVFLDLKYMAGKNVKGGYNPIAIWFSTDRTKQSVIGQNAEARQVKVVGVFNDGSGGAYLANLWESPDKTVSVFWYHLVPPFTDGTTLENEIQKTIDSSNSPSDRIVFPAFRENENGCKEFTTNLSFCTNYLNQSSDRIKAFKDWVTTNTPPIEFQNGTIDLLPALDESFG
jgi:hypothetical protein